ncbi:MAG TPA: helix-turn-helix domain-containing protein [Burkholderiaceae bacterium]
MSTPTILSPGLSIDVLFVIVQHSLLLDIAGPAEAFRLANLHRAAHGLAPRFRLRFCSPDKVTASSVGLTLAGLEPLPEQLQAPTWVVLVGQPTAHTHKETPGVANVALWLNRTMYDKLHMEGTRYRLVAICAGALLAARGGLLTNRRCTTHHELLGTLTELAPLAHVVDNQVYVIDGPVATSAGITAGIDLALQLIAVECGEALATSVAEDMVMYIRRSTLDPRLSPYLANRNHLHAAVHRVQDAIHVEWERDWDTRSLAAVGHVTERHLLRLFNEHTGASPLQYLQSIRLERARRAIERGASVTQAAELSGFRSSLQLRRAWSRQWGGSPRDAMCMQGSPEGQHV